MSAVGIRDSLTEVAAIGSILKDEPSFIGVKWPKWQNSIDRSSEVGKHSGYQEAVDLWGFPPFSEGYKKTCHGLFKPPLIEHIL